MKHVKHKWMTIKQSDGKRWVMKEWRCTICGKYKIRLYKPKKGK